MSHITKQFQQGKVFASYLVAGFPSVDLCVESALQLVQGGVNLIEIGLPFSDPVADGPVIQEASTAALRRGSGVSQCLEVLIKIRQRSSVPLVVMSYFNPILQGGSRLLKQLREAGADGLLVVDLPLEAADEHLDLCQHCGLDPIFIATGHTPLSRIQQLSQLGRGFLYYACRNGTTGVRSALPDGFEEKARQVRDTSKLPLLAGFGIGDRQSAQAALTVADGFVVGSAFIRAMAEQQSPADLQKLAQTIDPRRVMSCT